MSDDAIIMLEEVVKNYQMGETTVRALRGSSLDVKAGDFLAIMGPSGSGKSTLMNMIGALDVPTDGRVLIEDNDVSDYTRSELAILRSEKIGFVFQQFNLIHSMDALENVMLPMIFTGTPKQERVKRATDLLEQVGLGDRIHHRPNELSGGQQQRVSIARALANDPDIILADEPTGNVDSETGDRIMEMLTELNDEGKTILMVTHDPHDAEFADRVVEIKDGVTRFREEDE